MRRLGLFAVLVGGCLPELPPLQRAACIDFVVDQLEVDALPDPQLRSLSSSIHPGTDFEVSWRNRAIEIGSDSMDLPTGPVDERIEISGPGIRTATLVRSAGSPTAAGQIRSITGSAMFGGDLPLLTPDDYSVEIILDDDDAMGVQCNTDGWGWEIGTIPVVECFCQQTYHDVDLIIDHVGLQPLSPDPGERFSLHWENRIDVVPCQPGEHMSGRYVERISIEAVDGTSRYPAIERTVDSMLLGSGVTRVLPMTEFNGGSMPEPGDYLVTIELDTTGLVPECATLDDEVDLSNNSVTVELEVAGRR